MSEVTLQFEGLGSLEEIKHAALFAEWCGFPLESRVDSFPSSANGGRFEVTTDLRILPNPDEGEEES